MNESSDKCQKCGQEWEQHEFGVPEPYCPVETTEHMTTQPDIDAIARESAEACSTHDLAIIPWQDAQKNRELIIASAIRRALEPLEQENKGLVKAMALKLKLERHLSEAISERDALVKIAEAADQLEALLSRNCGSTDDWPISLKVSGDYAQELAGKLTALTRALNPYRKAKNNPGHGPAQENQKL